MAWWLDPLTWRLASAAEAMRGRGEPKKADALNIFVGRRGREIRSFASHFLTTNRDGEFEYPVTLQTIDELWSLQPIEATLGAGGGLENVTLYRTPLAKITMEQRRQVDAFAHILIGALMAARENTHIVRVASGDPLRNPNHPSDLVGVSRIASKRASERGIDKMRIRHAKGVAAKIAGSMHRLYGRWRWQSARNLTELVTGVRLKDHEMRALIDNLVASR